MAKKFYYYTVNVIIPVNFKMSVLAQDADEAIRLCEDKLDPSYIFEEYSNDTCGIDVPYDSYDDVDETDKFELKGIEYWDGATYELDDWEKPEEVELEFEDDEYDEDENEDEE